MSKTVKTLRAEGNFVAWVKLPRSGNQGKDRAIIMRHLEQRVDDYLAGRKRPKEVKFEGPEGY